MAKVFVSYSSQDRDKVKTLVADLVTLGHTVWFDQELTGGQVWWDAILANIRDCSLFIFATTQNSLQSAPCRLEYTYAHAVKRPILPILVDGNVNVTLLPVILQERQIVDYRTFDRTALLSLVAALGHIGDAPLLPDPLPAPPQAPISPIARLREQIDQDELSLEEQVYLFHELKRYADDETHHVEAHRTLEMLSQHSSLRASVFKEINSFLATDNETSITIKPQDVVAESSLTTDETVAPSKYGVILITRPGFGTGNDFLVEIDGQLDGMIDAGNSRSFNLIPGKHSIKLMWKNPVGASFNKEATQEFDIAAGEIMKFTCKFAGFWSTDIIFNRDIT